MYPVISSKDLNPLLWQAINDSAVYSALVPWILDVRQQAPTLSAYIQHRQILQDCQLQAPHAMPQDMRQCLLQAVERCCNVACSLGADTCPISAQEVVITPGGRSTSKYGAAQPDQSANSSCCLRKPAVQLAKLHGHMLSHGLVPKLADHLRLLLLLLTSGPLPLSNKRTATTSSSSHSHSNTHSRYKRHQLAPVLHEQTEARAFTEGTCGVSDPEQLLSCRTCAARYAAKALECCGKLLCCMPHDLTSALMSSPHVQHYAPSLVTLLAKTSASSKTAATLSRNSTVVGSGSNPQDLGQQQQMARTPAGTMAAGCSSADPGQAAAAGGGLSNSGTPWSSGIKSRPSTGGGAAKLSGLGMLVHNTPGSAGGRSTGGQGPAGKANNAAVCNREKSRDLFFSILRRCSSRLEALRQQQAAAADLQDPQQQVAAAVVFNTELQELMADVGIAAKQLLLQLAPGNQVYLAELFTACVLQAASTGEPILEPQLALMAERDPGKFHKLQQRLADRSGGAGAVSPGLQPTAAATASQAAGMMSRPRSTANRPSLTGARPSTGRSSAERVTPQLVAVPQQQLSGRDVQTQQQQQQQQCIGMSAGSQKHKARVRPVAQGLAATGLMCKTPTSSSSSTNAGGTGRALPTATHQIKPTPGSAGGSTGNSFRLAAAAGLNTPVPFGAGGNAAGPPPAASPLLPSSGSAVLAQGSTAPAGANDLTPVLQQQAGASSKSSSALNSSVSRVVQFDADVIEGAGAVSGLFASGAVGTGAVHRTPASAPAGPHGAAATQITAAPGSAPLKAPNPASHPAAVTQQQAGSITVLQQLLADMPAGQHVLMLVLHAADSSSFNQSLLNVMLARAGQFLSSGPASLSAAGGLGQQASAVVALASYSSYLSFVAGATHFTLSGSAVSSSSSRSQNIRGHSDETGPVLLQQQPVVDVASLLAQVADNSRSNSCVNPSWCAALAVPFTCSYLQFIRFNPSAASSPCVQRVTQQLQLLQALPCMSAAHSMYGSLPACISSCLQLCECLQQAKGPSLQDQAATAASEGQAVGEAQQVRQQSTRAIELSASEVWWCETLQEGSQYVDSTYWAVCCPGLQQLNPLLITTVTAAQRQQQQQKGTPTASEQLSGPSTSRPAADATKCRPPAVQTLAAAAAVAPQEQQAAPPEATTAAVDAGSSSPAGSVTSLRHTTPLLLAPRDPPTLDQPPAAITAALAEVNDPMRQQLQQALLGQYSTDDNPVKMRDVLALVNGILCANSLSLGLCQGVPPVLQQHLDTLSQEVQDQLGPVGATGRGPLQGQDLARAVHSICNQHSAPAIGAALESAMQRASEHACQAATAACTALLPTDVPPAATAAAAALVASSCKASCAQRLLQEVPVLVQSSLADQADELVKLVTRQWAVHTRITAPTAPAPEFLSSTITTSSSSRRLQPVAIQKEAADSSLDRLAAGSSSTSVDKAAPMAPRRINPVPVGDASMETKGGIIHSKSSSTGLAAGGSSSENINQLTAAPSEHNQAARLNSSSSMGPAPCSASAETAVVEAALAAPVATAQDLLLACSSPVSRQKTCTGCAADAEGLIDSMLQQVAVAWAQASLCAALKDYLAAVTQLLPETLKQVQAGTAAEHSVNQQQQLPDKKHDPWCAAVRAAACTAELLIAGVTAGVCSLPALEQQLVMYMNPSGSSKSHQRAGKATAPNQSSGAAVECTEASARVPAETKETLYQLLAGAVVHAFLTNPRQQARLWSGVDTQCPGSLEVGDSSQHFVVLPAILMKAARTERPAWLLKQLRCWIQDTTLGY